MTGENEKTTMLQGRGISKYYGAKQQRRQVLHDVDIDVRSGECLAVIGGSGSGKTTLTRVLLGLEHAETGEITYFGKPVQGEVAGELRRSCGLVFQSPFGSLDPRWRVGRSVAEPLRLHHPDWSQERIAERVSEAFRMVSLDPAAYENPFLRPIRVMQPQWFGNGSADPPTRIQRADERRRRGRTNADSRIVRCDS